MYNMRIMHACNCKVYMGAPILYIGVRVIFSTCVIGLHFCRW